MDICELYKAVCGTNVSQLLAYSDGLPASLQRSQLGSRKSCTSGLCILRTSIIPYTTGYADTHHAQFSRSLYLLIFIRLVFTYSHTLDAILTLLD